MTSYIQDGGHDVISHKGAATWCMPSSMRQLPQRRSVGYRRPGRTAILPPPKRDSWCPLILSPFFRSLLIAARVVRPFRPLATPLSVRQFLTFALVRSTLRVARRFEYNRPSLARFVTISTAPPLGNYLDNKRSTMPCTARLQFIIPVPPTLV